MTRPWGCTARAHRGEIFTSKLDSSCFGENRECPPRQWKCGFGETLNNNGGFVTTDMIAAMSSPNISLFRCESMVMRRTKPNEATIKTVNYVHPLRVGYSIGPSRILKSFVKFFFYNIAAVIKNVLFWNEKLQRAPFYLKKITCIYC